MIYSVEVSLPQVWCYLIGHSENVVFLSKSLWKKLSAGWLYYCFTSRTRLFQSYRNITSASKRLQNVGLYLATLALEQRGFLSRFIFYGMGPRLTPTHPKKHPIQCSSATNPGNWGPFPAGLLIDWIVCYALSAIFQPFTILTADNQGLFPAESLRGSIGQPKY